RLMLHHREGISFIDLKDILLVQREERTTVLYTVNDGRYVTGDTLAEMEERLHSEAFFRCHKSYIINLNHIKDITPYGRWTYVVRLEGIKHDALITHEKYEELEQLFR
ncbi:MAG: LytTR family DNA-binding domain-containing protein, partial [Clostridia bacterium]